jgi:hypothetical protein
MGHGASAKFYDGLNSCCSLADYLKWVKDKKGQVAFVYQISLGCDVTKHVYH